MSSSLAEDDDEDALLLVLVDERVELEPEVVARLEVAAEVAVVDAALLEAVVEAALEALLGEREHYRTLSQRSREAAHAFVEGLGFESIAERLAGLPAKDRAGWRTQRAGGSRQHDPALNQLAPDRRLLLALRLRKKRTSPENP